MAAGFEAASGSSFERESFREDDMPDGEEDLELCDPPASEDARDANSSESRGACRFPYWILDIAPKADFWLLLQP